MFRQRFRFRPLPLLLTGAVLLAAAPGLAQERRIELAPMLTYSFGTGFEIDDFELGRLDLDLEDSDGLGLILDIPVSRSLQVEVMYLQQETELVFDEGLLTPSLPLGNIDIETYHAGVLWQMAQGQLRPFFVMTAGFSTLDLDFFGADSETELSLSFGAGIKALFGEHFGFRVEGRFLVIDLGDNQSHQGCCYQDYNDSSIAQGVVSGGLLFAF